MTKPTRFSGKATALIIAAVLVVVAIVWYCLIWVVGQATLTPAQTKAAQSAVDTINDAERGRNPLNVLMLIKVTAVRPMSDDEIRAHCRISPAAASKDQYFMVSLSYWDPENGLMIQRSVMPTCGFGPQK